MRKRILSLVLTLCLMIPCVAMLTGCKKGSETTMSLSVNPEVSFVVDGKNKIVSVHYENEDAGTIYANVDFVGKDVDSAIQIFIEQSAISGHLNLSGEEVDIEVNGSVEKDIEAVQTAAKAKVEEVFGNLGVQVQVQVAELDAAARHNSLVATAAILAPEKTTEELNAMEDAALVELIKAKQEEYKGLAYNQIATIKSAFSAANNAILQAIETLRATIDSTQDMIASYQTTINGYKEQIAEMGENNPLASGIQALLTTVETQLATANQTITETRTQIETKIQEFLAAKEAKIEEAKANYEAKKAELVTAYKAQVATAKTNFVNHLDTAKSTGTMTEEQYNYWKNLVDNQAA